MHCVATQSADASSDVATCGLNAVVCVVLHSVGDSMFRHVPSYLDIHVEREGSSLR